MVSRKRNTHRISTAAAYTRIWLFEARAWLTDRNLFWNYLQLRMDLVDMILHLTMEKSRACCQRYQKLVSSNNSKIRMHIAATEWEQGKQQS